MSPLGAGAAFVVDGVGNLDGVGDPDGPGPGEADGAGHTVGLGVGVGDGFARAVRGVGRPPGLVERPFAVSLGGGRGAPLIAACFDIDSSLLETFGGIGSLRFRLF